MITSQEAKILDIIQESNDWNSLSLSFLQEGVIDKPIITKDDRKYLVSLVQRFYAQHQGISEQECDALPGITVTTENCSFYIHGLVHDTPLTALNDEFRSYIRTQLRGKIVLCEDGFSEWLSAKSFDEINALSLKSEYIGSSNFAIKNSNLKDSVNLESICGMNDLLSIRKTLLNSYLPEPLAMNTYFFINSTGNLHNPLTNVPAFIKRLLHETKYSMDYAKQKSVLEMHIVVGCAHEPALKYLFNNLEILDKYPFLNQTSCVNI